MNTPKTFNRSQGVNISEELLAKLCERTFIPLWTYANPYRRAAKELCDVLVIFNNHVFIFSIKEIVFNKDADRKTAWKRWKKRAIDASMKQIKGAEKWIKNPDNKIFIDSSAKQPLPIALPPIQEMVIHRLIVAFGAAEACLEDSNDNLKGSLGIAYKSPTSFNVVGNSDIPFMVSLPNQQGEIFHIFNEENLEIILSELDTAQDFIDYLLAKEKALEKFDLVYAGEEDLLANYFYNFDSNKQEHFIGNMDKNADLIFIGEGEWKDFTQSVYYRIRKERNKISYHWDALLHKVSENIFTGQLQGDSPFEAENAFIEMAKEPRFMRRAYMEKIQQWTIPVPNSSPNLVRRSAFMSYEPNKAYVLLQTIPRIFNGEYEPNYLESRAHLLEIAAGALKNRERNLEKIIGIAFDAPGHPSSRPNEHFLFMNCRDWGKEKYQHYKELNKDFNFFQTDLLHKSIQRVEEFPSRLSTSPAQKKRRKIGRNEKCPCGSGKKFKKCCLVI